MFGKDKYTYFDVSIKTNSNDELSGLEKLEANNAKISDLDIILAKINNEDTIKKLKKKYGIKIKDKEIEFYKKHMKNLYFSELVLQFFADEFGGYCDLQSVTKVQYIELVIIFKRILTDIGFRYVQHLLVGNISSKIKKRRVSNKQLERIQNSDRYKRVMKQYSMVHDINNIEDNMILRNIAILINTPFEFVDYDRKDKLGVDIEIDADTVADEYLRFEEMI